MFKVVKQIALFSNRTWLKYRNSWFYFNAKRNKYVVNICTLVSGTIAFTAWQMLYPLSAEVLHYPEYAIIELLASSGVLVLVGFCLSGDNRG